MHVNLGGNEVQIRQQIAEAHGEPGKRLRDKILLEEWPPGSVDAGDVAARRQSISLAELAAQTRVIDGNQVIDHSVSS